VEAQDGGDARAEASVRDALFDLAEPFGGEPRRLVDLPLRYAGARWSEEGYALVSERWSPTRERRTYHVPTDEIGASTLVFDVSTEDRFNDPGSPIMRPTRTGTSVLLTSDRGRTIYLSGAGASPDGVRPFVRRFNLDTRETDEVFRSTDPYYESVSSLLDVDSGRMLIRRESVDQPPNYFVREKDGSLLAVTEIPHPHPDLSEVQKEFLTYERDDGVALSATLYLPPGYQAERDGPLPTLMSASGAIPFVTRGYAVLDATAMPIIGEGDDEPNDTFVKQLVSSAEAAINEGARKGVVDPDRVAVGGHSYGAFMTANLLAHSDLFRAGIARSGAYNRALTPFGFQNEQRTFWEAPEIYFAMSPFMHANDVDEPIMLIHGQADNNSGTFPVQSERFYAALKGHGATARLVMLPHESHGYRARESVLHMLWEESTWLDTHVRDAKPRSVPVKPPTG
jgi:dipeptidyl aminopeptidase/acylaminoacyl peptidase